MMTFLKDEQLENAVRFSKRDKRILTALMISGIITTLLGLYFLSAYKDSDNAVWFIVLAMEKRDKWYDKNDEVFTGKATAVVTIEEV